VKLLSEHLEGEAFLEGEEKDFPRRIIDDIVNGDKPLELMVWFRNLAAQQYLEAIEVKKRGGIAVLDCFWLTNQPYIDSWVLDEFEKNVLTDVSTIDLKTFPWPDKVIVLQQSKGGIRHFSKVGGREFEDNDEYFEKQLAVHRQHDSYFESLQSMYPNIVFFDRASLDFLENKDDFDKVLSILD
jgi:deoxyadenosine/deoxycytidine kinase